METECRYLLHLLGAYIRKETPEISADADWQKLIQLAQIHSVTGILGYMTMKHPICPDAQAAAFLRSGCRNTVARFAQRSIQAEALSKTLEQAGIDHILMKGYVLRELYPVPELRTFNDIDIVIRPADRQRSDELMVSMGFQRHTDWEPVYSYFRGNELYEIHTEIMEVDVSDRADYKGYFRNMWEHAEPVSPHSFRFTPEFHFLYLLTHIAKHVHGSGAGIRMYMDVAVFVQHYGKRLDWTWIREQLRLLKLEAFAGTVLTAAESWFGVSCPMEHGTPDQEVMEQFLAFTMEAGTFGHHNRDEALTALKHGGQAEPVSRLHHLLRETFPKAQTIESRYTYLQDKPWLLPAAWVHRLVKNRDKLGLRTRKMKNIISADETEVWELRKLMGDIGL
ncbi:MAG: nucleotidyltransferase family protein [Oscillospiraceae bacterium]|nr:nucleotidyltransferase family protein [Oscillospiraceae bacterium]